MNAPLLSDYDYQLPENLIATEPLTERDTAKLLVYGNDRSIIHSTFKDLEDYIPENALLVLNDTRVVHARLMFKRDTGAIIEVFCLHPIAPYSEINLAMGVTGFTTWECMAGNQKRWKSGEILTMTLDSGVILKAELVEKKGREVIVSFSWNPAILSWSQILEQAGKMPLPPYIHRESNAQDELDYQTVFAKHEGAVAAPTAGLHFTDNLIEKLKTKGIDIDYVTLHVGAGTFQPVEHENILEHPMHVEQLIFDRDFIRKLSFTNYPIIALGTTSLRALESLYWFGNQLQTQPDVEKFFVSKLQPYKPLQPVSLKRAMNNILHWMNRQKTNTLHGATEIFIFPGYEFKVCRGLITNFHLPKSTLLMLVSAFIGEDWKILYGEALKNDYRFLSYGDGMMLMN